MLLNLTLPRIALNERVGEIVLEVPFPYSHNKPGRPAIHGEAGVWYVPDDLSYVPVKMTPESMTEYDDAYYRLQPTRMAPPHCLHRHRFLVRYADRNVYVPTIQSTTVMLIEVHGEEAWELVTEHFTLTGVTIRDRAKKSTTRPRKTTPGKKR